MCAKTKKIFINCINFTETTTNTINTTIYLIVKIFLKTTAFVRGVNNFSGYETGSRISNAKSTQKK